MSQAQHLVSQINVQVIIRCFGYMFRFYQNIFRPMMEVHSVCIYIMGSHKVHSLCTYIMGSHSVYIKSYQFRILIPSLKSIDLILNLKFENKF
jgi:hypothetical protein